MKTLRALVIAVLAGLVFQPALEAGDGASAANTEIDYFGTNLFLGIAYHRWGCAINGPYSNSTVTTNNTYQGFTATQYCHAGWTWSQESSSASTYYGYTTAGNLGDDWLGYYFCEANYDRGEAMADGSNVGDWHNYCHSWQGAMYSNNSTAGVSTRDPSGAINYCSYNVLTNCNSDCWIGDFSTRQGAIVPTLSPCF